MKVSDLPGLWKTSKGWRFMHLMKGLKCQNVSMYENDKSVIHQIIIFQLSIT